MCGCGTVNDIKLLYTIGAYNPITGEMYEDSPKAAAAAAEEKKTPVSKEDKGRGRCWF